MLGVHGALRACDSVGNDVVLVGRPHVRNAGRMVVGNRVELKSLPVVSHFVTGPRGRLEIGDDVFIAHGAAIAAHHHVAIGANAVIGPFVMIMDTDFHEAGNYAGAGSTAPITIGAGARLGAGVTLLRGSVIGAGARLGARVTVLRGAVVGAGAVIEAGAVVKGEVAAGARIAAMPIDRVPA